MYVCVSSPKERGVLLRFSRSVGGMPTNFTCTDSNETGPMAHFTLKSGSGDVAGLMPDETQLMCGLIAFLAFEATAISKCIALHEGIVGLMPVANVARGFSVAFMQHLPTIRSVFQTAVSGVPGPSTGEDMEIKLMIATLCKKYKTLADLSTVFLDAFAWYGIKNDSDSDSDTDTNTDTDTDTDENGGSDRGLDGPDEPDGENGVDGDDVLDEDAMEELEDIMDTIDVAEIDFANFTSDSDLEMHLHGRVKTLIENLKQIDATDDDVDVQ